MTNLLPNMVILDKKERESISSFCDFVNKNELTEKEKKIIIDYIISNVTYTDIRSLNKGIYELLSNYLNNNMGEISFNLFGNSIKEITLGNIKAGPLFSNNFTNEELSDRFLNGKNSCGVLPNKDNMQRLLISYNSKNIYSSDIIHKNNDRKNAHIGEYYFNRDDILNTKENPYIFRFTSLYKNELQIEVLNFDKEGNFITNDIYIDYLATSDNINYKVIKQFHNEIENINDLNNAKK